MELFDITFYLFALITIVSAGIVVFSRNIVYSAFSLLFTFFGVAGLYVLLQADFLAVTQILIYVGGILVLMLFGIMLTSNVIDVRLKTRTLRAWPAVFVVATVAGSLAGVFYSTWKNVGAPEKSLQTTAPALGEMLMTSYVLPFEMASIVLLVALMGAAMFARHRRG